MSHPRDLAAAADWIKSEVSPEVAREVGEALPSLPVGTAFVCSASLGIGQRIEVRSRQTFNSGATPAPGQRKPEPKVLATVDIERLGREIAAAAKRIQETFPEFLLKRIAELERAGKQVPGGQASIRELESNGGRASMTSAGQGTANRPGRPATSKELQDRIFSLLGEGERKLLTLLIAAYPESLSRVNLATQGGYSNAKSGGFAGPLARLVELGFVEAVKNGVIRGSEMLFLKGKVRTR